MRGLRAILWALVAIALIAMAYLMLRPVPQQPKEQSVSMTSFGGPFTLTGADGKPFSSANLNGNPYVIFFGFTHCPDVCPTTLARLVKLRKELSDEPFEIVFVTVDPDRDGPTEVGSYAKAFNSPIIGLTGSPAQIEQVKKQFGIFSKKVPDEAGDYSVDHTATVFLFDRDGKFVSTVAPDEGDEVALEKLKRISA